MKNPEKPLKTVTSGLPELYPDVEIYASTLEKIKEKHPEEYGLLNEIYHTIEKPDRVHESKTRSNAVTLINEKVTSRGGDPLRVAVKTVEVDRAIMSTAHFSSVTDQGPLLWERTDDE
jgi:hypothetical protein